MAIDAVGRLGTEPPDVARETGRSKAAHSTADEVGKAAIA
jgi:hypothetical protein